MAQVNKNTLKEYFRTGSIPNQQNFDDLIDSVFNQVEDASLDALSEMSSEQATGLVGSSGNATFNTVTISDQDNGLIIGNVSGSPRVASARDDSPASLTVQARGTEGVGSVEIFPSGTAERSHFLATNAADVNNFGFVEFEVNGDFGWLHAQKKGTGTAPTRFRIYEFTNGIRLENSVRIGDSNNDPEYTLDVQGTGRVTEAFSVAGTTNINAEFRVNRTGVNSIGRLTTDTTNCLLSWMDATTTNSNSVRIGANGDDFRIIATTLNIDAAIDADNTVTFSGLPTSDPSSAGQLWNDSGTVKISAG